MGLSQRRPPVLDAATIAATIAAKTTAGAPLLLVRGGFGSPIDAPSDRVGAFVLDDPKPRPVVDVWLRERDYPALARALSDRYALREGGWDVLFATAWELAWSADGGPFVALDHRGLLARAREGRLVLRERTLEVASVLRVEATLGPGWAWSGVEVVLAAGAETIARKENEGVRVDPCYDGIALMVDAAWACEFGRALAAALDRPFVDRTS